jgi:hypothetical protein
MGMTLTGCMMQHSFLRDLALSFKHTTILEKKITPLATTLLFKIVHFQIYKSSRFPLIVESNCDSIKPEMPGATNFLSRSSHVSFVI